jgi:hypothetical protein
MQQTISEVQAEAKETVGYLAYKGCGIARWHHSDG